MFLRCLSEDVEHKGDGRTLAFYIYDSNQMVVCSFIDEQTGKL